MIRTALRFGAPLACVLMSAEAAFAADKPTIDTGDTAWLLVATCLVLMMNIPGLALFCTTLSLNLLADGLNDALNPKS